MWLLRLKLACKEKRRQWVDKYMIVARGLNMTTANLYIGIDRGIQEEAEEV